MLYIMDDFYVYRLNLYNSNNKKKIVSLDQDNELQIVDF